MPIFLGFLLWGVAEVLLLIALASWLGFTWTVILLLWNLALGLWIKNRAQRRLLRDGDQRALFSLLGGLLFILPGFLSDGLALLFCLPPLRAWVGHWLWRRFKAETFVRRYGRVYEGESKRAPPLDAP